VSKIAATCIYEVHNAQYDIKEKPKLTYGAWMNKHMTGMDLRRSQQNGKSVKVNKEEKSSALA